MEKRENNSVLPDEKYMDEALALAEEAAKEGEVPVGAVVVWDDGRVVGRGRNRRERAKNALAHAEIEAINEACRALGGWRLHKATLFVTLEPCPMCAGAILNARIKRVVFAAPDKRFGALGSHIDLSRAGFNHRVIAEQGDREEESLELMSSFFQKLRNER